MSVGEYLEHNTPSIKGGALNEVKPVVTFLTLSFPFSVTQAASGKMSCISHMYQTCGGTLSKEFISEYKMHLHWYCFKVVQYGVINK